MDFGRCVIILLNIGVLLLVALLAWWLSGHDSNLERDDSRSDFQRRLLRVLATLFLVESMILIPIMTVIGAILLGVMWASCISELVSHRFRRLIDPGFHDERAFDPGKSRRYLDTIGHLIRNDRRDEAIKLCEELKQSSEVDLVTLETTLEFLGVKQERIKASKPVAEASRLRTQGKFAEAEQLLRSLLAKKPDDLEAALVLVRLYAQDLHQPEKARAVLDELEKQTHIPAGPIEFARRSIDEWNQSKKTAADETPKAESVDDLLAQGFFGTAIELLETQIKAQPKDYELRLKLAEVQAVRCKNFIRAEKIIRQMDATSFFSAQQMESARWKFREWQEAKPTSLPQT
jgi:thioredoxin-like negative regulator of GroEL